MLNERCFRNINEEIKNIDKGIRIPVFKLNQNNIITFTSCDGHDEDGKPYFGIILKNLKETYDLLTYIEGFKTWYKLSNKWLCHDDDNYTNKDILETMNLDWENCYFLTFKCNNLDYINTLVNKIIEWKNKHDQK